MHYRNFQSEKLPNTAELVDNPDIKNIIESLIFGSDSELSSKQIKEFLEIFKISASVNEIETIIENLNKDYSENGNAFEIIKISGGYQFATKKEFAAYVGKLYTEVQRKKLSQSALETLAIISYKQPVTRNEIEFIRGVNVDYIVNSLLERELITIIGRANTPGRPILYGTTKNFLRVLGLNSMDELPKLKEINEILKTEKVEGITEADIDLFNSVNENEIPQVVNPVDNTVSESSQNLNGENQVDENIEPEEINPGKENIENNE